MKQKKWNRIFAYFLAMILLFGTCITSDMQVQASGAENTEIEVHMNPLYEDVLDEVALRAELEGILKGGNGIAVLGSSDTLKSYDTLADAAAYVREQMVQRNTSITLLVNKNIATSGYVSLIADQAMETTEECSGQEGDALLFNYKGWSSSVSGYDAGYNKLTYAISYRTDATQEAALTEAVNMAMQEMNLNGLLEYDKVKRIHQYICDNVNYDYTYSKYTAYDALCTGEAVCQGYAILFYRLAKEADLSVRIIAGTGYGGAHAWNIVQVGGRYYNIDCTWDGQSDTTYDSYLLKNEEDFVNHIRYEDYQTAEFLAKYPIAENSWTDVSGFEGGCEKANLDVSFTTLADTEVNSTASGKPKLLIFFSMQCGNCKSTIGGISDAKLSDIDVIAIESNKNSQSDLATLVEERGWDNITFTYDTSGMDYSMMWDYVRYVDGVYQISWPYIVYIDENNMIQHSTNGYMSIGEIRDIINMYLNEQVIPTRTTLNKNSLVMEIGATEQLTATIAPANTTYKTMSFESSDKKVAVVDSNGNVKAVGAGTATITAYVTDAFSMTQSTCTVQVVAKNVSDITLNKTELQVKVGETSQLTATVLPKDAENKTVKWSTTNASVASVSETGVVTGVGSGTATITATATDGSGVSGSCVVTVTQPVTGITLNQTALDMKPGESVTLSVTVSPDSANNKVLSWKSDNEVVAVVDITGKVTAISAGTATITATATDGSGQKASCTVTVTQAMTFVDVEAGAYYESPVLWAVSNGITNGYGSATTFCPDKVCTRGQIVTFLWRAKGCPEPASLNNPFTDVATDAYYYKAVLWAVEQGITNGYGSDTIFNPDGECTRGQVATFMWRAEGKPASSGNNPFMDLKVGEYYCDAVLWAVEKGVTNGYGSAETFCPDRSCTRGEIVTFLYRGMN